MATSQWYSNYTSVSSSNWTNQSNIKTADDNYATNTSAVNYIKPWNWGQTLPAGDSISGIEVRIDAKSDDVSENNYFDVDLSWNNASSWTTAKRAPTSGGIGTTEQTVYLGGAADTWGRSWTSSEMSTSNFHMRAVYEFDEGTTGSIDYFAWRVYTTWSGAPYQEENVITTDALDGTEENGSWYATGYNYNVIGYWTSGGPYEDHIGLTFSGLGVPQGAIVNEAYVRFAAYTSDNSYNLDTQIWAVDTDDFVGFDGSSNSITTLASSSATDAKVDWDLSSAVSWTGGVWYSTPDIKTVLQEVIDRAGWQEGNRVGIAIENLASAGDGSRAIYDSYTNSGPYLLVKFSIPKTNSALANIVEGGVGVKNNSVRANIETTYSKNNSSKANIVKEGTQVDDVKANIVTTSTDNNSAKANIAATKTQNTSARGNIGVGTYPFSDDFNDNDLDQDKWELGRHATEASVEETGVLKVQNSTATTSGYVKSRYSYVPQYTTLEIKIGQHSTDGGFKLCPTDPNGHQWDVYSEANWYNFQLIAGTILSPNKRASGVGPTQIGGDSPALSVPYWMRIRIDNGTIYFDYRDNLTDPWTNISSEAWSLASAITSPHYIYLTGYNTQTTGVPHFDDFNMQEGVQTEKSNSAKASIVASSSKANSAKANISVEGASANNTKANILVVNNASDVNSLANIEVVYTQSQNAKANLKTAYSSSNNAKANIETTYNKNNSSIGNIESTGQQPNSARANILGESEINDNNAKGQIIVLLEQENHARAFIYNPNVTQTNRAKGNILTTYYTGMTYDWQPSYLEGANRGWQG